MEDARPLGQFRTALPFDCGSDTTEFAMAWGEHPLALLIAG